VQRAYRSASLFEIATTFAFDFGATPWEGKIMPGGFSPLALLLIGFIIGWIVEWLIDLWVRQNRADARAAQLEDVLRDKDARLVEAQERAQAAEDRLEELEARLGEEKLAVPLASFEETPGLALPPEIETIARDVSVPGAEVEAPGIEWSRGTIWPASPAWGQPTRVY
jgi:hypothetical protein